MLVDHANEHRPLLMPVRADRRDLGRAVLQRRKNIRRDLVGMRRDDGELAGRFGTLDDIIADKAGNKAIQHAQADRLVVVHKQTLGILRGIDKEGNGRNDGIEGKGHPKEIQGSVFLADVLGNDIRTARRGVHTEAKAVNEAGQHAAEQHGKDSVVPVGVVLKALQSQSLKKQKDERVGQAKDERALGKGPIDQKIGHNTQRHVDDQRHITDTKAGLVLDHGGNAVEPRRCKAVIDDKQLVVEGKQDGGQHDAHIGQQTFANLIFLNDRRGVHHMNFSIGNVVVFYGDIIAQPFGIVKMILKGWMIFLL